MKNRWAIVAGIVAGLLATFFFNIYRKQLEQRLAQAQPPVQVVKTVPVVVAAKDIAAGTEITEAMVSVTEVPEPYLQPYAQQEPSGVVGRVAAVQLATGEQILSTKLKQAGMAGGPAAKIPPGKRAVTMDTNPVAAVNGFVRPGDHVDLLWTFAEEAPGKDKQLVTLTLFQRVLVLAMDNTMVDGGAGGEAEQGGARSATVTFALTPQEAELLLFARQQGHIQMALRPPSDTEPLNVPPVSMQTLLQLAFPQLAAQAQPSAEPKTVEIYRGLEVEVVAVPGS